MNLEFSKEAFKKIVLLIYIILALFIGTDLAFATDGDFGGITFGAGFTLTHNSQEKVRSRIDEAQIVNGIVRVTKEQNQVLRLMLETHYFATPKLSFLWLVEPGNWGVGPFMGVQMGSNEIIDALGAGIMLGFKRTGGSKSFNVGVGYIIDNKVKILGDGFKENEPPPAGETEVRFKEKSQGGVLIIMSFSFYSF